MFQILALTLGLSIMKLMSHSLRSLLCNKLTTCFLAVTVLGK